MVEGPEVTPFHKNGDFLDDFRNADILNLVFAPEGFWPRQTKPEEAP